MARCWDTLPPPRNSYATQQQPGRKMFIMTITEIGCGLGPQTVYVPMTADLKEDFKRIIGETDGCEILDEAKYDGLTIFKVYFKNLYHLFAAGAMYQIDKSIDQKKQLLLTEIMQSGNNNNVTFN